MKVNKAIFLRYSGSNNATTSINVNFPVKSIHIKSASFTEDVIGTNGELYLTLTSDLTNGEPIAIMYSNSTYPAQQFCDVSFQPYKPFIVNGTYNFTLFNPDGSAFAPVGTELVSLIVEFNGVDTTEH
jgi:hypothetical protein